MQAMCSVDDNRVEEDSLMRTSNLKKLAYPALLLIGLLGVGNVWAFGGGKAGTTDSGGTSSSGDGTSSSCIGAPTGGKYSSDSYSGSSGCTTEVPGTDSDGDTMTDTWEDTYALDKYDSTDRWADGDSDGSTNAREYAQGGDPTNSDSDGDGVNDSDDADPDNAAVSILTVDGTYKGGNSDDSQTASP